MSNATKQASHPPAELPQNDNVLGENTNNRPTLKPDFIKSIDSKDFVTYQGILDLAHQKGLFKLTVEILQYPSEENNNSAVVYAVVESERGELFSDVGDASPANCNAKVSRHLLRMASTRAKARALRDFTNVGIACLEELGDVTSDNNCKNPPQTPTETGIQQPTPRGKLLYSMDTGRPDPSDAQLRAIENLARRRNITPEGLDSLCQELFQVQRSEITRKEASTLIQHLQQAA